MELIRMRNVTKDYGDGRGVFDMDLSVYKGEVMGFLGPNGAGKTTSIRMLMGFIQESKGEALINGLSCFEKRSQIQAMVGYLPGELSLMDDMNGLEFIHFIAKMKKTAFDEIDDLMTRFELYPHTKIREMSKGTKQKLGLICAFMGHPKLLILDEPTSGLDPLMQQVFVELLMERKAAGATILLSSHSFEEVEKTCDRVAIINRGRLVSVRDIHELKQEAGNHYTIRFADLSEKEAFMGRFNDIVSDYHDEVTVLSQGELQTLLKELSQYRILQINREQFDLEGMFIAYYGDKK